MVRVTPQVWGSVVAMVQTAPSSVPAVRAAEDRHPEKLSDLIERLARDMGEKITLRQIAEALEDRSFGAFLLVFAIPNLIPLPPGATIILGMPMAVVAWQMVIGYDKVWLPRQLADYSMDRATFQKLTVKITPWLRRAELWVRPRNWPIRGKTSERLFGLFALILAIVCIIPIPFGNWPPAFAVAVLGVAHTERDGNCLAFGILAGTVAILLASAVLIAAGLLLVKVM